MKKGKADYMITLLGVMLLGLGLYLGKTLVNPQGVLLAIPYVCIGFGCGIFGHGMGNIVSYKAMQSDPKVRKQLTIHTNDERNIAIANRAKAKAYDLMSFVFGALMLTFAFMGVAMLPLLLLVLAYLFVQGYAIYYRCKYDKEM